MKNIFKIALLTIFPLTFLLYVYLDGFKGAKRQDCYLRTMMWGSFKKPTVA
jgi:hypothetical protein